MANRVKSGKGSAASAHPLHEERGCMRGSDWWLMWVASALFILWLLFGAVASQLSFAFAAAGSTVIFSLLLSFGMVARLYMLERLEREGKSRLQREFAENSRRYGMVLLVLLQCLLVATALSGYISFVDSSVVAAMFLVWLLALLVNFYLWKCPKCGYHFALGYIPFPISFPTACRNCRTRFL